MLVLVCAGIVIFLLYLDYSNRLSPRYSFGKSEWKRDRDWAFARFAQEGDKFFLEVAGDDHGGVVHGSGAYRLEDGLLFQSLSCTLDEAWVDTGLGADSPGELTAADKSGLGYKHERKRRIRWVDADHFQLTESWWGYILDTFKLALDTGETWNRQKREVEPDQWHYSIIHKIPERWKEGRWQPRTETEED